MYTTVGLAVTLWCVLAGFYAESPPDDGDVDHVHASCDVEACALRHSEPSLCSVQRDHHQPLDRLLGSSSGGTTRPDDWTAAMSSCATTFRVVLRRRKLLLLLLMMMMMMTSSSTQHRAFASLVVTVTCLLRLCRLTCRRLPATSFVYR